jgi:hypothetical protein
MTSAANSIQIGGDHYRKMDPSYQHWDFVADAGLGYYEGCATKYIARHASKNGLQDLLKARHYVAKLIELADTSRVFHLTAYDVAHDRVKSAIRRFVHTVEGGRERELVFRLSTWVTIADLRWCLVELESLADITYPPEEGAPDSGYVNQG